MWGNESVAKSGMANDGANPIPAGNVLPPGLSVAQHFKTSVRVDRRNSMQNITAVRTGEQNNVSPSQTGAGGIQENCIPRVKKRTHTGARDRNRDAAFSIRQHCDDGIEKLFCVKHMGHDATSVNR